MTDEIRLVIPAEEDFHPIVHLVTGGLALRLDVTYDDLEDLQVGLDAVLGLRDDAGDVVVSLGVGERELRAAIGPLPEESLAELDEDDGELGLRRVLETVADGFEVEHRADGTWLELTKGFTTPAGAGA